MTQTTLYKPASALKICANCPFFQTHNEPEYLVDKKGKQFNNPRRGCGWCNLFNQSAKEHHEMTQTCVSSGSLDVKEDKTVVTHELEENLTFFPEVEFDELEAFPTQLIEDEADQSHSEYQVGSVVKVVDKDEHHSEWGVFEVVKVRQNLNLYSNPELYLNGSPWHYLLSSKDTAQKLDGVWVREDEICNFNESHLICANDDIF